MLPRQERFSQPRVKLIKSPWEAALETGSVDTAFQEMAPVFPAPKEPVPVPWSPATNETFVDVQQQKKTEFNPKQTQQKTDLYMPNMPKAWNTNRTKQLAYGKFFKAFLIFLLMKYIFREKNHHKKFKLVTCTNCKL